MPRQQPLLLKYRCAHAWLKSQQLAAVRLDLAAQHAHDRTLTYSGCSCQRGNTVCLQRKVKLIQHRLVTVALAYPAQRDIMSERRCTDVFFRRADRFRIGGITLIFAYVGGFLRIGSIILRVGSIICRQAYVVTVLSLTRIARRAVDISPCPHPTALYQYAEQL